MAMAETASVVEKQHKAKKIMVLNRNNRKWQRKRNGSGSTTIKDPKKTESRRIPLRRRTTPHQSEVRQHRTKPLHFACATLLHPFPLSPTQHDFSIPSSPTPRKTTPANNIILHIAYGVQHTAEVELNVYVLTRG